MRGNEVIHSPITYRDTRDIGVDSIVTLYGANGWSSAEKPDLLHKALINSETLVSAWHGSRLIGLGNAISDGFLVVYDPHLLVLPELSRPRCRHGIDASPEEPISELSSAHARRRREVGEILRETGICACRKHQVDVDFRRQRSLIRAA